MPAPKVAAVLAGLLFLGLQVPIIQADADYDDHVQPGLWHFGRRDLDGGFDLEIRSPDKPLSFIGVPYPMGLTLPPARRDLDKRDIDDEIRLLRRGGRGDRGRLPGLQAPLSYAPLQQRDLDDDFDLVPREARQGSGRGGGGGGSRLASKIPSTKGSKLDFAGKVVGAAGDIAGAALTPGAQAPPPTAAPMQRRHLEASDMLGARSPRGGSRGSGGGSKLNMAGKAIGAADDVAGAFLAPGMLAPPPPLPPPAPVQRRGLDLDDVLEVRSPHCKGDFCSSFDNLYTLHRRDPGYDGSSLEAREPRKAGGGGGGHRFTHSSDRARGQAQINAAHDAAGDVQQQE